MIDTASQLNEKLQDTLDKVESMGRTAGEKFAQARRDTANAYKGSASLVRDAGEVIDDLAARAASKLDDSTACVRNYDLGGLLRNFRDLIRRNPARFVTGAAAAGYLIGRAARRR